MSSMHNWHLLEPKAPKLFGEELFLPQVERRVAPGDGMHKGDDDKYLETGANALHLIHLALQTSERPENSITQILDYACGYGRVLRWLRAAFPSARIVAADTYAPAVIAVKEIFDVDALRLDRSLQENLGQGFDLIWMGSLATHLSEEHVKAVFARLASLLSPGGTLVATTHGPCVASRIASGERLYRLDEKGVTTVLRGYEQNGYGFAPYPNHKAYGISVCTASKLLQMLEDAMLCPILYQERGWARHQDCVAAVKGREVPLRAELSR